MRNNVATPFTNAAGNEAVAFDAYKVDGVEASLDAKVTDQWHILANATVMDPIVTASPQTAVQATVLDHAPQGVPRYLANLWTTYDFSIAGIHGFQVGAGVNYQDKTYSDNTNVNSIPAYTILNAEIAYLSPTLGRDPEREESDQRALLHCRQRRRRLCRRSAKRVSHGEIQELTIGWPDAHLICIHASTHVSG